MIGMWVWMVINYLVLFLVVSVGYFGVWCGVWCVSGCFDLLV